MNLEQYARQAQNAQQPQETQEEPQAQPRRLDAIRAQLDAEKLYSLQAEAREAIATETKPSALAARLTAAIFGPDSPEAGTVNEAIEKTRRPGGYDYAIEIARQRRQLYKKQLGILAEMQKELAAQMGLAAAEERELMEEKADADRENAALLAVMEYREAHREREPAELIPGARDLFKKAAAGLPVSDEGVLAVLQFARETRRPDAEAILLQARALYEKHSGSRQAMGLLYGIMAEWQGRDLTGPGLDFVQQAELQELKGKLSAAAGQ